MGELNHRLSSVTSVHSICVSSNILDIRESNYRGQQCQLYLQAHACPSTYPDDLEIIAEGAIILSVG